MPAGRYVLRLEGQWEKWQSPATVTIRIEQNVAHGVNLLVALIVLSVGPVLMLIYHIGFERRRWSESMFAGGSSSDGGGDDDLVFPKRGKGRERTDLTVAFPFPLGDLR